MPKPFDEAQKIQGRAQAALEYLLTYGWALVLIATIISAFIFIVSSPASSVVFYSSDPTKILLKAGSVYGSDAEIDEVKIYNRALSASEVCALCGAGCSC